MKYFIIVIAFSIFSSSIFAQTQRRCGFKEVQKELSEHPNFEAYISQKARAHKTYQANKMDTVIKIPVVVHVIYRLAAENISAAQINSQIAVLNQDYRKLNPDTTNAAGSSIADVKFEFVLATKDPNGNVSNGITRTQTNVDDICDRSSQYYTLVPAWNRDRYLNIWVCDIGNFLLGFAYPPNAPGVSAQEDGVVIGNQYFGTMGTATPPYNKGRTTTHEVAHFFDLLHIWGNDFNPSCSTDDLISDTPNQDAEVYICTTRTSCGSVDQLSNFLQYVDDDCMGNFTLGQKTRMRTALYTQRDSLQFGGLFGITSLTENEPENKFIIYPNPNNGAFTLFSENFNFFERLTIQVFDVNGKPVNFKTNQQASGLSIQLEKVVPGIYFVQLNDGKINTIQKLLKQ